MSPSDFVDAFFRTGNRIGDNQSILQKVRGHRKDATRIQPQDVLSWYARNGTTKKLVRKSAAGEVGHVALVDSPPVSTGDGLGTMTVCESRGGGIGIYTNQYTIREVLEDEENHTIYRVDGQLRGLEKQKSDPDNFVRVYPCP